MELIGNVLELVLLERRSGKIFSVRGLFNSPQVHMHYSRMELV